MTQLPDTQVTAAPAARLPGYPAPLRWLAAAAATARPRQWPKNLLVFAAPLAGATLGRADGIAYALVAAAAFVAASSSVYFINDLVDAERDRRHPDKCARPIASGQLPEAHVLPVAAGCAVVAAAAGLAIGERRLTVVVCTYLCLSFLYTLLLKHVPFVEMMFVAAGFLLRALGGAAATHVRPSGWFLLVCSLGAFMVAIAKRFTELRALGAEAVRHRPVMAWYSPGLLRASQRLVVTLVIGAYLIWASTEHAVWMRDWHLASVLPLTAALIRFDYLTARASSKAVEDLISRDPVMLSCELAWLVTFAVGL
ncbi:MAG TPA: decaprenyl-phosphate phosphoribosyltransferase [Streptosporangiaceae bacterium]